MRQQHRFIGAYMGLVCILIVACNSKARALKCIRETTESLLDEACYQNLQSVLRKRIALGPVDSSYIIEHVPGKTVLFNDNKTKAIATELLIYDQANGRHGYGIVYLAVLKEDSGWVFMSGNAPNFLLSVRDDQVRDILNSKKLEEHILGRLVDDGLMNRDGCTLNQDYIEHRWLRP